MAEEMSFSEAVAEVVAMIDRAAVPDRFIVLVHDAELAQGCPDGGFHAFGPYPGRLAVEVAEMVSKNLTEEFRDDDAFTVRVVVCEELALSR